jgi:ABC-type dipeptide/oligopeptide/nickel transport system permease subunit
MVMTAIVVAIPVVIVVAMAPSVMVRPSIVVVTVAMSVASVIGDRRRYRKAKRGKPGEKASRRRQ